MKNMNPYPPNFADYMTRKFQGSAPFDDVTPPFLPGFNFEGAGSDTDLKPAVVRGLQRDPNLHNYQVSLGRFAAAPGKPISQRVANPAMAGIMDAGLGFIENITRDENSDDDKVFRTDRMATSIVGNRGDYTQNEGFFKPDQFTPTQYRGQAEMGMDFTQTMGLIPDTESVRYDTVDLQADKALMGMMPVPTSVEDLMRTMPDDIRSEAPASRESAVVTEKLKGRMMDRAKAAYDYYVQQKGLAPHVAAGIVGNLAWESGMNPTIKETGNTGEGRALAQWGVNARYKDLQNYAKQKGLDVNDMYTQLDFILDEPGWGNKAMKAMQRTDNAADAAVAFGKVYEIPKEKYAHWDKRKAYAQQVSKMEDGGEVPDLYSAIDALDYNNDPDKPKKPTAQKSEPTPQWSDDIYKANASMVYYKEQLNKKLREKNPTAYDSYMKGLGDLRRAGNKDAVQKYIQETAFDSYLSSGDVRETLGDNYSNYLNSIDVINKNNLKHNQPRLYGDVEGNQKLEELNYGRRFASMPVNPSFAINNSGRLYERNYIFNPDTGKVGYVEKGDMGLRPKYEMGGEIYG